MAAIAGWTFVHELVGRTRRFIELPGHHRRGREEIQVVVVVGRRIEAVGVRFGDVPAIDIGRFRVGGDGAGVIAGPHVRVRRHVHEMPGGGHERFEAAGARERAFRRQRRFGRVNVVVIRADVIGMTPEHAFEHVDDLRRAFAR